MTTVKLYDSDVCASSKFVLYMHTVYCYGWCNNS